MALNLEHLATDTRGVTSAHALASRVPGATIDSSSAGQAGGPEWDAVWIRSDRTAAELLLEVHPVDDAVVAGARRKWANQLASVSAASGHTTALEQVASEAMLLCIVTVAGDFDDSDFLDLVLDAKLSTWPGGLYVENDGFYVAGERVLGTDAES